MKDCTIDGVKSCNGSGNSNSNGKGYCRIASSRRQINCERLISGFCDSTSINGSLNGVGIVFKNFRLMYLFLSK